MPPQTNQISQPGAAALGFDFAIAPEEDALSEKQAAGPPAASTRRVLRSLQTVWRALRERRRRKRSQDSLRELSDRQLMDIGLSPGDIECVAAHRAFEELKGGSTHLWLSRGVM